MTAKRGITALRRFSNRPMAVAAARAALQRLAAASVRESWPGTAVMTAGEFPS